MIHLLRCHDQHLLFPCGACQQTFLRQGIVAFSFCVVGGCSLDGELLRLRPDASRERLEMIVNRSLVTEIGIATVITASRLLMKECLPRLCNSLAG